MRLANILPAPENLPGAELKGKQPLREHWDSDEADVKNLMGRFPSFRSFMNGVNMEEEYPVEMIQRCLQLKTIRGTLYAIARLHSNDQLTCASVPVGGYLDNLVSAKTDAEGSLRIELDPLLRALEGVEVRRIRECPMCGALYWAGRLDKPACKECVHAFRQRRYRENYKEKYKKNYKEKYILQRYSKAEGKTNHKDTAARMDRERKELESLPKKSFARRCPRLPGEHK